MAMLKPSATSTWRTRPGPGKARPQERDQTQREPEDEPENHGEHERGDSGQPDRQSDDHTHDLAQATASQAVGGRTRRQSQAIFGRIGGTSMALRGGLMGFRVMSVHCGPPISTEGPRFPLPPRSLSDTL